MEEYFIQRIKQRLKDAIGEKITDAQQFYLIDDTIDKLLFKNILKDDKIKEYDAKVKKHLEMINKLQQELYVFYNDMYHEIIEEK